MIYATGSAVCNLLGAAGGNDMEQKISYNGAL